MGYTYALSDLHGSYDKYRQVFDVIGFTDDDTLFVLGDVVDRGKHSMKILQDMMDRPNVIPLFGNHDFLAWSLLNRVNSGKALDDNTLSDMEFWISDGGITTLNEFKALPQEEKEKILKYFTKFKLYHEVSCGGRDYVLVHAGLGNFHPDKRLSDYSLYELLCVRIDYSKVFFQDKILVTGHTPTCLITPGSNKIYKGNNHIAIDCGCVFGGKLGIICLDDGREFYI